MVAKTWSLANFQSNPIKPAQPKIQNFTKNPKLPKSRKSLKSSKPNILYLRPKNLNKWENQTTLFHSNIHGPILRLRPRQIQHDLKNPSSNLPCPIFFQRPKSPKISLPNRDTFQHEFEARLGAQTNRHTIYSRNFFLTKIATFRRNNFGPNSVHKKYFFTSWGNHRNFLRTFGQDFRV